MNSFLGGVSVGAVTAALGLVTLGLFAGAPALDQPQTPLLESPAVDDVVGQVGDQGSVVSPAQDSGPVRSDQTNDPSGLVLEETIDPNASASAMNDAINVETSLPERPSVKDEITNVSPHMSEETDFALGGLKPRPQTPQTSLLAAMTDINTTTPNADNESASAPDLSNVPDVDLPVFPVAPNLDADSESPNIAATENDLEGAGLNPPQVALQDVPDLALDIVPDVGAQDPQSPQVVIRPRNGDIGTTDRIAREDIRVGFGKPAGSFLDRKADEADDVGTLPNISTRPLERYATQQQGLPDVPRLSVILIDDGTFDGAADLLADFPFPISIAISPYHPNVKDTVSFYRSLGFEVFALADIPTGALPSDVDVALAATFDVMNEVVGVMEPAGGAVHQSRQITDAVASYVASEGYGLLLQGRGLNTAEVLAEKAGAAVSSVFRSLETGDDMRRVLIQAAFRAKQRGSVVLQGQINSETISALVSWGLQDQNADLAIVPVSTILKEKDVR